jgi:Vps5 C terminal like
MLRVPSHGGHVLGSWSNAICTLNTTVQEFVRLVKSCKATMADRALAMGTLQTARADVAAKRSKLMKLRGTPGIRVRRHPHIASPACGSRCNNLYMHRCLFAVYWYGEYGISCA